VEAARLLIENGASLNQPSAQGITPLDWAAEYLGADQRNSLLRIAAGDKIDSALQDGEIE
jgi:ankyrin repeat protein